MALYSPYTHVCKFNSLTLFFRKHHFDFLYTKYLAIDSLNHFELTSKFCFFYLGAIITYTYSIILLYCYTMYSLYSKELFREYTYFLVMLLYNIFPTLNYLDIIITFTSYLCTILSTRSLLYIYIYIYIYICIYIYIYIYLISNTYIINLLLNIRRYGLFFWNGNAFNINMKLCRALVK